MGIATLINNRRTIHRFQPGAAPDDAVMRAAIEQAVQAPNHHLTQPWRFYLLGAASRERVCALNAKLVGAVQGEKAAAAKLRRWREIPGWLALTCRLAADEITRREDYASCCCAAQNLALLLWDAGVGMKWTTGAVTRTQAFYDVIGADPAKEEAVGLFWYGFPAAAAPPPARRPPEDLLTQLP